MGDVAKVRQQRARPGSWRRGRDEDKFPRCPLRNAPVEPGFTGAFLACRVYGKRSGRVRGAVLHPRHCVGAPILPFPHAHSPTHPQLREFELQLLVAYVRAEADDGGRLLALTLVVDHAPGNLLRRCVDALLGPDEPVWSGVGARIGCVGGLRERKCEIKKRLFLRNGIVL